MDRILSSPRESVVQEKRSDLGVFCYTTNVKFCVKVKRSSADRGLCLSVTTETWTASPTHTLTHSSTPTGFI